MVADGRVVSGAEDEDGGGVLSEEGDTGGGMLKDGPEGVGWVDG